MKVLDNISIETLQTLLRLDPVSGRLYWRRRASELFSDNPGRGGREAAAARWNTAHEGKEATGVGPKGYARVSIFARKYMAHRVVFAIMHGRWPTGEIDHIDGDRSNNRPTNLREATSTQNAGNSRPQRRINRYSQYKGVTWAAHAKKWRAQAHGSGNSCAHIGYFQSEEAAARAYDAFARRTYGEFAWVNFPD